MTTLLLRPDLGREAYNVHFRVRVPATARGETVRKVWRQHVEKMRVDLGKRGYELVGPSPTPPVGPFPVFAKRGLPKRVPGGVGGAAAANDHDAASRVETVPNLTKDNAHLLTDTVEWEFCAIFNRPVIRTEVVRPSHDREQRRYGDLYSKRITTRMA